MEVTVLVANVPEHFSFTTDITISHLLSAVSNRTRKPIKSLSLRFAGKLLDKLDKTLSFYGIVSGCKINARVKLLPGLDCLGPFSVVPNINAQYDMEGDPYIQMIGPQNILTQLYQITHEYEHFFQVSPPHLVTLPDNIRLLAHIPLGEGVSFRWVYPFVKTKHSTAEKIKELDPSDPLIALILFGGYLYVDRNGSVIQVNGVKPGPGLFFDGPYKMAAEAFNHVYREGRFQETTIELEDCKAFCWFLPGEDEAIKQTICTAPFFDDNGKEVSIRHGAFGYQCSGDEHRIFRISDNIKPGFFPVKEFTSLAHVETSQNDDPSSSDVQTCVMCLDKYSEGDKQRVVNKPCNHACLHHSCANQLLSASSRPQCPICRMDVIALEKMPYLT